MKDERIEHLLLAWLSARSVARGLPAPVADHGGYRIDTHNDVEIKRWVFARAKAGLAELARSIEEPRYFLKLCGTVDVLRSVLPNRWQLHPPNYFMQADGPPREQPLASGYLMGIERRDGVVEVRVTSDNGELAASGYAAETQDAFVYDRIVTTPQHRRKGLGHAVMAELHRARWSSSAPQLLVATEEGGALYTTLGWRIISPYSTASIVDAGCPT